MKNARQHPSRPLSPHLQIYKYQLTAVLSITHRATGLFLFGSSFLWSLYFIIWPSGKGEFLLEFPSFLWACRLMLASVLFSLFYHLLNGIRHLFWDMGIGLELSAVYRSGWIVVIGACVLAGVSLWALL